MLLFHRRPKQTRRKRTLTEPNVQEDLPVVDNVSATVPATPETDDTSSLSHDDVKSILNRKIRNKQRLKNVNQAE